MSIYTDGFGTIVAGLEGGAGGGNVIPDGGEIQGTYDGNLLCEGDVSVTGELVVNGSMLVRGELTNYGGHEMTVHGDFFGREVYIEREDQTQPQGNFSVDGDLLFTYMNYTPTGGVAPLLRVGGDLIGTAGYSGTYLNGTGVSSGSPGLSILVYGDLTVSYVELDGFEAPSPLLPGAGGTCTVYGTASIHSHFSANGGDAPDVDAPAAGWLDVYGDLSAGNAYISLYGGNGNNSSASNGGHLDVGGSATIDELEMYGGNCYSDSENHRSGNGGEISVQGNLNIDSYLNLSGGTRYGTLTASNTLNPPYGGYLWVGGNLNLSYDFAGEGGDVYTGSLSPHEAGRGSEVYIRGSLVCSDDFRAYGGYNEGGRGGNGGNLDIEGDLYVDDELEFYGGGSENSLSPGTNGGSIYVRGHANIGWLDLDGGGAFNANAGNGGSLNCQGNLFVDDGAELTGGSCNSNNEVHVAGSGGYIYCKGDMQTDNGINLTGGDRYGDTTVAVSNPPPQGGYIDCGGSAKLHVQANGGGIYTAYPNSEGGWGGTVTVEGHLTALNFGFLLAGGPAVGLNGGRGGTLNASGFSAINRLWCWGGASDNSTGVGGDAASNGSGGSAYFKNGCSVQELDFTDGSGAGAVPTGSSELGLNGSCTFNYLNMPNRAESKIFNSFGMPVSLRIRMMPGKQTLNDSSGTASSNIAADIQDSIFITGASSTWYKVTGTSIFV